MYENTALDCIVSAKGNPVIKKHNLRYTIHYIFYSFPGSLNLPGFFLPCLA